MDEIYQGGVGMMFSTKGRYGLRAMIDIAMYEKEGPVSIQAIAERQGISSRYLGQLLTPLKQAGLVRSIRGPQGGYVLAKSAEDITAGDIIRVLEGPISPVDCISEVQPEECIRSNNCVTRDIWLEIRDSVGAILDSHTLASLVKDSLAKLA